MGTIKIIKIIEIIMPIAPIFFTKRRLIKPNNKPMTNPSMIFCLKEKSDLVLHFEHMYGDHLEINRNLKGLQLCSHLGHLAIKLEI